VHTVIETPDFVADAKDAGMSQEEVAAVVLHLGTKPQAGDRIEGTSGARKVRFAGRGKGKSGGYRVISYFELKKILADIADIYRKGVRRNVKGR
jgi:hypothetical protein